MSIRTRLFAPRFITSADPTPPKPKHKYVKVLVDKNVVWTSSAVSNFSGTYICNQDSSEFTEYFILGGKWYRNTGTGVTLIQGDTNYVTCCANGENTFGNATNIVAAVKSKDVKSYSPTKSTFSSLGHSESSTDYYYVQKVCGCIAYKWDCALALFYDSSWGGKVGLRVVYANNNDATASIFAADLVTRTSSSINYTDICGGCGARYVTRYGYALRADNTVMCIPPGNSDYYQNNKRSIYQFATNMKYISCRSLAASTFAGITTDNYWQIDTTKRTEVKVKAITAGDGTHNYAIGYDDNALYYRPSGASSTITKLDDTGTWTSLAQGVNSSYGMGIKDGKLYRLVGTTLEQVTSVGSGCIQIQGTGGYLLYCEE